MNGISLSNSAKRLLQRRDTWVLLAVVAVSVLLVLMLTVPGHGVHHVDCAALLPVVFLGVILPILLSAAAPAQPVRRGKADASLEPAFQRPPPFTFAY